MGLQGRRRLFVVCLVWALALPTVVQGQEPDPDRYIVGFSDVGRGKAALAAAGAAVLLDLPEVSAAAARIPAQALAGLQRNPNIAYIERDVLRYPMAQSAPYGIGMVQANQLSDSAAGTRTICIIDSGYDLGHEDLSDNSVDGTSVSGTGAWSVDGCGHGTHVAGTVAAVNNTVGVVGVMPNKKINLHIVKVFGSNCSWAYSSSLVSAANICHQNGANIISMSLGGSFSSQTESNAFQSLYNQGVLSIAAAGNAGNTRHSYPASYSSVVSVAAIDSAKVAAGFSQRNSQVELAAPGVAVRSTVPMGTGTNESLSVGGTQYEVIALEGSPNLTGTGALVNCGLGTSVCSGAAGKVCLIERGTNSFAQKVQNCQAGGGAGAVIYNNAAALFSGTLGGTATTIPSVGTSGTTGAVLVGKIGQSATVTTEPGHYAFFDGTSMATPHVSGVAALVWSHHPTKTNADIRQALAATAEDLGSAGRDNTYGWGLVRAKAAFDLLNDGGGEPPPPPPPPGGISLTVTAQKVKGFNVAALSWSGATTAVDIVRNSVLWLAGTANDGSQTDDLETKGKATHTYQVCETGTSTCSAVVTVNF